jgi:hypothetical protein
MTSDQVFTLVGKSIRSRALMAHALCALAEEEYQTGQPARAKQTIQTMRTVLLDIDTVLSGDTSYLPHGILRDTSELLAGLDDRLAMIEALTSSGAIQ